MDKRAKFQKPEMPDEFVDLEYDLHRVEASRGVLEIAVRQLRAFARCMTASKSEADELVEDTLMLFLAEDRVLRECDTCFAELLEVFRRVHGRTVLIQASRGAPDKEYAGFMQIALPEREVAALVIGGGMMPAQAAELLKLSPTQTEALLETARRKLGPTSLPEWPFLPASASEYLLNEGGNIG
ncbi:hypothetical protein HNE_3144 [Hyphomonas neptunium ATCC 15444]|uniref:Uncharacterized protein n=2 Tax=Hyphomonas TaxID=85 RepID=Q0BXH3_HYPNA|nr:MULTISPECIES: hypothetical protein [Hyphomonas]ABI76383.1 hypothetical protein HNE_3144 [Hyphomonas neptunium ATCC 15444]KCZ89929.1 hypothetical protein HHI_13995 [Hyphomonas hirschiana VP5]